MDWTVIQDLLIDIATQVVGVGGPLNAAEVELYQNDITPTPETPIGDYTLATYTGYAAEVIAWVAPTVSDAGQVEVQGIVGEFRPTDAVTPNNIFGVLITDGAGGLLAAARFANAPIPMGSALNNIIVTPIFRPGVSGDIAVVS